MLFKKAYEPSKKCLCLSKGKAFDQRVSYYVLDCFVSIYIYLYFILYYYNYQLSVFFNYTKSLLQIITIIWHENIFAIRYVYYNIRVYIRGVFKKYRLVLNFHE